MEIDDPSPADIDDPLLTELFAYWLGKRDGRTMPARADIDPLEMRSMLGQLILVDVLRPAMRFRIRLHGSILSMRAGYELTGKMLDELPITEFRVLAMESFARVATGRKPFWARRNRILDDRATYYDTLILPLSSDQTVVNMLLVGLRYLSIKPTLPTPAAMERARPGAKKPA